MNESETDLGSANTVKDFHRLAARQAEYVIDTRFRESTYQDVSNRWHSTRLRWRSQYHTMQILWRNARMTTSRKPKNKIPTCLEGDLP